MIKMPKFGLVNAEVESFFQVGLSGKDSKGQTVLA